MFQNTAFREIEASSIDLTQVNKFYLKTATESSLRICALKFELLNLLEIITFNVNLLKPVHV
jgi:hypothetical protein